MLLRPSFFDGFFQGVLVAGALGIVWCRIYQLGWQPGWTEAEALRELWFVYGLSVANMFGMLWFWKK